MAMLFTRRRIQTPRPVALFGEPIVWVDTARYLPATTRFTTSATIPEHIKQQYRAHIACDVSTCLHSLLNRLPDTAFTAVSALCHSARQPWRLFGSQRLSLVNTATTHRPKASVITAAHAGELGTSRQLPALKVGNHCASTHVVIRSSCSGTSAPESASSTSTPLSIRSVIFRAPYILK